MLVSGVLGFAAYGMGNACFGGAGFDAVRTLGPLAFGLDLSLLLMGGRYQVARHRVAPH